MLRRTLLGLLGLLLVSSGAKVPRKLAMALPESAHPYTSNLDETQTYTLSGSPTSIWVTFGPLCNVEDGYDYVYLYDKDNNPVGEALGYTSTALANFIIEVPGDTIKVQLVSDSSVEYYGYKVTRVANTAPPIGLTETEIHVSNGQAANHTLAGTNGTAPYTFVAGAGWPAGLSLASNGVISGTPTTTEAKTATVTVTDSLLASATVSLVIYVEPPVYLVDPVNHLSGWGEIYTSAAGAIYHIRPYLTAGTAFLRIWKSTDGVNWNLIVDDTTPGALVEASAPDDPQISGVYGNQVAILQMSAGWVPHLWLFTLDDDTFTALPDVGTPYDISAYAAAGGLSFFRVWFQGDYIFNTYTHYTGPSGPNDDSRSYVSVYKIGSGWLYTDIEISSGDPAGTASPHVHEEYNVLLFYVHGSYVHWLYFRDTTVWSSVTKASGLYTRRMTLTDGTLGASSHLQGSLYGETEINNGYTPIVQGTANFQTQILLDDYIYSAFKFYPTGGNYVSPALLKWGPFVSDTPTMAIDEVCPSDNNNFDEHVVAIVNGKVRVYSVATLGPNGWDNFGDAITYYESSTNGTWTWGTRQTFFWWQNNWPASFMTGAGFPSHSPVIYQPRPFTIGSSTWAAFIATTDYSAGGEEMTVEHSPALLSAACRYYSF